MTDQEILNRMREEVPGIKLRDKIVPGTKKMDIRLKPIDAKHAVPNNVCNCAIARAAKRVGKVPVAIVNRTTCYLAMSCGDGGWFMAVKYTHNGKALVDALDVKNVFVPDAIVTIQPPAKTRKRPPTQPSSILDPKPGRPTRRSTRPNYRRRSLTAS